MRTTYLIIPILFGMTILSCSGNGANYNSSELNSGYKKIADQKYHDSANYLFSPDSEFVVCYTNKKLSNTVSNIKFFIYNIKNQKIEFEDNSKTDKIEWINNSELKVMKRPGIISVDEQTTKNMLGYVYDLNQRKKRTFDYSNKLK